MDRKLVYDVPTRIFHWLFTALFLIAFIIAKQVDDESPYYAYHMLAGLTLGSAVLLRIIWGFVGSQHARFNDFVLSPTELIAYFKNIFASGGKKWAGHNPASSWAAMVMMGLALGLGVTGLLMASGQKEALEDVHEVLANTFFITALLHIAGVIFHSLKHKDALGFSMIDGKKTGVPSNEAIPSAHRTAGLIFLVIALSFGFYLYRSYDPGSGNLNLFGKTLQLSHDDEHKHGNDENSLNGQDEDSMGTGESHSAHDDDGDDD